jgi:hypothetical protein
MLKLNFVTKSWADIVKDLQKIENWKDKSLNDLLKEVQNVYVWWDEENKTKRLRL